MSSSTMVVELFLDIHDNCYCIPYIVDFKICSNFLGIIGHVERIIGRMRRITGRNFKNC
jgi:hypothetical protein